VAFFEVFIPSLNAGVPGVTLTLEAPNWIGALRTGLHTIGEGQASISNVMCDIREDKSIHVTDVASHRVFRLREVAAPGAASAGPPPAPVGTGSESSGGKTLVEFRRPDLSMPPASSSSPTQPTAAAVATQAKPSHLPAPVKIPSARGHHVAAADDEPDTIETERATRPEIPRRALGLDDASLPGPAVSPPSPPPPAPSPPPARAAPTLLSTPILRPMPVPLEAPTGTSSKAYDLTLRQPKAPAFSDSLADALDDSSVGPVLSSPSAVPSAEQRTESGLTPLAAAMPPPMTTPPVTAPPAELSERTVTASMSSSLLPSPLSPLPSASPLASSAAEGRASAASARRATTGAATQPAVALESGVRARSTASTAKASGPVSAPTPRGTPAPPPKRPSGQFEDAPKPVRREVAADNPTLKPAGAASAEAIADAVADVFDATHSLLMEGLVEPRRVAEALLDVALAHVPAESGSFYLADLNGHVLSFAAVRGPKAAAIIRGRYTVPVGQGIIGFCALEGVCLRVADMQKDPHYASEIANAVGYDVKDTLCASAEKDGRLFGAIQLINSTESFTSAHMEVLRYIGLTAAQLLERHAESV
jgi:hypothetical protein